MAELVGFISSIIAILELSGTVIDYVHKLRTASTDCDRILLEISSVTGFLSCLKELISKAESQDIWLDTVRSLDAPNGPVVQYSNALDRLAQKLKPMNGWRKAGKAMRWPFEKTEIIEIIAIIERQKTLLTLALGNDNVKLSLAIQVDVAVTKNEVLLARAGIEELEIQSRNQHMITVYEWLDPLSGDFERKQADILNLDGRQDGVCNWLLRSSEFAMWMSGTNDTLWCTGAPGIGKTIITSFVINHLLEKGKHSKDSGTVFLYCNYKDSDRQTVRNMIASLLHQLALQQSSVSKDLEALYERHKHRGSQPSLAENLNYLAKAAASFTVIYIVIDALDEYPPDLLERLLASVRMISPRAKYFFTSRPNISLDVQEMIHLKLEAHQADIQSYLLSCIQGSKILNNLVRKNSTLIAQIIDTIVRKANGMFLLAKLHFQSLQSKTSIRKLKVALETLPEGRDEAYDEAVVRIQSQNTDHAELAKKVLLWVVNAKRPLKMEELLCALAIEPEDPILDPDGLSDPKLLISICSGIVSFEPESRIVGLVHYTAQEYFLRKGSTMFPDAHRDIALICLTALNFGAAQCDYFNDQIGTPQLSKYAVPYWADHLRQSPYDTLCEELAIDFTCSKNKLALETVRLQNAGILILPELQLATYSTTGLCVLAAFGLVNAMTSLLGEDLRLGDSMALNCALLFAVLHGQETAATLLLQQGADANYSPNGSRTETALHYAVLKGHLPLAKLLLDHGADINAVSDVQPYSAQHLRPGQVSDKWTALHLAASLGHDSFVDFLVHHGAQISRLDKSGNSALHLAAMTNAAEAVRLLLQMDGNRSRNSPSKEYLPLSFPTLKKNADDKVESNPSQSSNLVNSKKRTALHLAAMYRSVEVVPLLVQNGADIDAQDESGSTALLLAIHGKAANVSIVRALVDAGADTNAVSHINGCEKTSALHLSVEPAKNEIMEILIANGANPNATNSDGASPLHTATWLGSGINTYDVLLNAGADINSQDQRGNSVLHLAVVANDPSIMTFFLDRGADVSLEDKKHMTALDVAHLWRKLYPCDVGLHDLRSVLSILQKAMKSAFHT